MSRIRRMAAEQLNRATASNRTGLLARALRRVTGRGVNRVSAFWFTATPNLGDLIAPVILRQVFQCEPVLASKAYSPKLVSTGSVLASARPGDEVWGSGILIPERFDGRGIRFLAVRGPRTRALIDGDVPHRYGDPATLLPLFYRPPPSDRQYEVGVVLHYRDTDLELPADGSVLSIDVTDPDWQATVTKINQCDIVVSSSLHGVIVAEAYGVPAVLLRAGDDLKGGMFKFLDYYESTGREARPRDRKLGLARLVDLAEFPPQFGHRPLLEAAKDALLPGSRP
jgi:pyruvyltransferase